MFLMIAIKVGTISSHVGVISIVFKNFFLFKLRGRSPDSYKMNLSLSSLAAWAISIA